MGQILPFPILPGDKWPWEIVEETTNSLAIFVVGILIMIFGLLIMTNRIPIPISETWKFLIGLIVFAMGILFALGYIGPMLGLV
jgi:hypothetical protein